MIGSVQDWAKRHQISRQAAYKRLRSHGIPIKDGKVDFETADARWDQGVNALQQARSRGRAAAPRQNQATQRGARRKKSADTTPSSLADAQLQRELIRIEKDDLELQARKGKLVDAEQVAAETERRFREDAEALLAWPARVSAEMAAELGVGNRQLRDVLAKYVRQFMRERSMVAVPA